MAVATLTTLRAQVGSTPVEGLREASPRVHAITGARIVPAPGVVIERGTLVLRDGVIAAVGAEADVKIERVLAITFTTAATGELRERIRMLAVGATRDRLQRSLDDWIARGVLAMRELRMLQSAVASIEWLDAEESEGAPLPMPAPAMRALRTRTEVALAALDAAWDLVKGWDMDGRERLRAEVPRLGLNAPLPGGGTLRDIAAEVLAISRSGLSARNRLNDAGDNETGYLQPLDEIVSSGKTPAERLLDLYHGEWNGDLSRIYGEKSF